MKQPDVDETVPVPTYAVNEAVIMLQNWFAKKAVRMTKDNVSLIDDVVQEMSLGVMSCRGVNTLSFYRQQACFRARNFLKSERRHAKRVERFSRLSLRTVVDGDEPYIEGLIDLEDRLSSRSERLDRIVDFYPDYPDERISA